MPFGEAPLPTTLADARVLDDPYSFYRGLREQTPVYWDEPIGSWLLTRYEDVVAALRRPDVFSSARFGEAPNAARGVEGAPQDLSTVFASWMLYRDPPDHGRLRGLMVKAFTPRTVAQLRPRITALVDELLDSIVSAGEADLLKALANPLPTTVILELLGVPPSQRENYKAWSNDLAAFLGAGRPTRNLGERSQRSIGEMKQALSALCAERRTAPRDDLISALLAAEDRGSVLGEDELLANAMLLLFAGNETTTNLIGNGLLALLEHPEEHSRLLRAPEAIPGAIDELLRFDSPVQALARVALSDVELGGKTIRRGERVLPMIGAANRDPAVFADPDRLDVTRAAARTALGFGHGIHFCVGAGLAKMEAEIALGSVLARLPGLHLDGPRPGRRKTIALRGLETLSVRWAPAP